MIKKYSIDLDIKQALTRSDIELVRLDHGTSVLDIRLFDGSAPYVIPDDAAATLAMARPDKAVTVLPVTSTPTGSIQAILTNTALALPGWALAEVVLRRGTDVLTSALIQLFIRDNIVHDGVSIAPPATPEQISALIEALNTAIAAGNLDNYALKTDVTAALAPYVLAADIKQADWLQPQSTEPDFIKNKPMLGTAATLDTGTTEGTVPLLGADGKLPESMISSAYPTIKTGTWTPTVGSETGTPPEETNTNRQGVYTRIGNLVAVQFFYQATLANGTGAATLGGLPFTPTKISTGATLLTTSATPWATALVNTGYINKLRFYKDGTVVSLTGFSGTVNFRGSFIYLI